MIPRSTAASICFSVLVAATRVREASLSDVADATDALALQKLIDELGGSLKYKQAESRQMLPINIPMTDQEKRTALASTCSVLGGATPHSVCSYVCAHARACLCVLCVCSGFLKNNLICYPLLYVIL